MAVINCHSSEVPVGRHGSSRLLLKIVSTQFACGSCDEVAEDDSNPLLCNALVFCVPVRMYVDDFVVGLLTKLKRAIDINFDRVQFRIQVQVLLLNVDV